MRFIEDDYIIIKPVRFTFYTSCIYINGHRTWYKVAGRTLEKVVQINSYYLLFVSIPQHEKDSIFSCSIYLINQSGRIIENWSVNTVDSDGGRTIYKADEEYWEEYAYYGYLDKFLIISPNIVTFQFNDNTYSLEVLDKSLYFWSDKSLKENYKIKRDNYSGFIERHDMKFSTRLRFDIIQKSEC